MRSISLSATQNTIDFSVDKLQLQQMSKTYHSMATVDVESTINEKISTMRKFYFKNQSARKKSILELPEGFDTLQRTSTNTFMKSIIKNLVEANQKKNKSANKKRIKLNQLEGVKTQRRQRFKRMQNPEHILQHYINKQKYSPNQQQTLLLGGIINLRRQIDKQQPFNLEVALQNIYNIMNIAVDLNQTKFLQLIVMMAGQICFEAKQLKSSFFFYTQAMIASTCTYSLDKKLQALIYLGRICMDIFESQKALIFLKKALQYAWKIGDNQSELKIYDYIGQCYNYEGKSQIALYYHNRYIQGQNQNQQSAVRRISSQMLNQYEKTIDNSEKINLSELFLQYLRLPITNFEAYPPTKVNKTYANYKDSFSPRKDRTKQKLNFKQLPELDDQIAKLLSQSNEFKTEIPSPDLHRIFIAQQKYGKHSKNIDFVQSNDFHKIVGIKMKQIDKSILKLPIQKMITKVLEEKPNPNWWQDIKYQSKKQRNHKLGGIRNVVRKSHLVYHKYPEQRKKAQSLRAQKINYSLNKTILNWIDPPKKINRID